MSHLALHPVRVPNMQQNTPSLLELEARMTTEEQARETDRSYEDQIKDLVQAHLMEKTTS